MSKTRVLAVTLGLLTLTCAGAALAGPSQKNSGTFVYLAWSATDTLQTDKVGISSAANMYVIYRKPEGFTFKGAEIDIIWTPAGDGAGCFDHVGTTYKTSAGTTCTYLNRGTALPVVLFDDPDHFHVAWANTTPLTDCTFGAGIQLAFQFDTCLSSNPNGTFTLTYASILDDANNFADSKSVDDGGNGGVTLQQPIITVNGVPVQPTTWGAIKRQFGR